MQLPHLHCLRATPCVEKACTIFTKISLRLVHSVPNISLFLFTCIRFSLLKVCLYDIKEGGGVQYLKTLSKMEGRILSLAWHPAGLVIAVGGSDSTIHLLDADSGHCSLRITLDEFQSRATLVWDLKFRSDFSIVTANSLGSVQVWNGEQGTLRQSFKLHSADVLTLAVSKEEDVVFAAGVDHQIIRLQRVTEDGSNSWVHSGSVRAHSHDVKSLAVSSNGLLASAGIDTRLVVYDCDTFGRIEETVKYSPFSSWSGRFAVASSASVLMFRGNTCLKLWRMPQSSCQADKEITKSVTNPPLSQWLSEGKEPVNFLDIHASTPRHILSSAISSDACMVAFSDVSSLWVYRLNSSVVCVGSWEHPACKLAFKGDGSEIALACLKGGGLAIVGLHQIKNRKAKFRRVLDPDGDNPSERFCFTDLLYSPDGDFMAAVDRKYRVFVFSTKQHQLVSKIPHLCTTSPPRLCFSPWNSLLLIFNSQDKGVAAYHLKKQVLSTICELECCERAIHRRDILGMALGIFAFSGQERVFGVYDVDCLSIVHLPKNFSKDISPCVGSKRKRNSKLVPSKNVFDYRELLFAASLDSGDLLVVEKPWTDVMKMLPTAIVRERYGT